MSYIIAWLMIPAGVFMIIYARQVGDFIGEVSWAEKFFLSGGTYTLVKLIGLSLPILGLMWITGGLQSSLKTIFASFI